MKKKIWIPILIVAVIAILVIPIPTGTYKDGGTREYTSLTYKIVDWNRLTDDGSTYSATKVYFFPNNFRSIDNLWYKEEPKVEHTFIATILEINGTSVTVQPVENSAILMSSDKVSFGTANLEKIDVEVGSVVKVIYTGGVMESYPAKVNAKSWSLSDDLRHMEYNEQWLDTAPFDIDGDGKEEQCTLSAGPTSGLFTFIFSVSENGNLEYFNIFNSPYTELQFEKNAEGIMMLVGKNDDKNCYMGMDISDGNIVISSDEQEISYWGEQGLNSPYAPKTASDLNNAIAKVLNEKYRAEDPDGLIHIENYYLLANETASGTPLKGNFGHMTKATVYLLVYHMKYSFNGDRIEEYEGNFVPTAITFNVSESGEYTLEEYWTPRTGTNYEKDVRNKFPGDSADNALNSEKFAEDLIKKNWRLANEYFSQTKSS